MRHRRIIISFCLLLLLSVGIPAAEKEDEWTPRASIPKGDILHDWIRLTNGEWLNGEIHSLRNGELIFDSDHFNEIQIDWEDVAELHSAGELVIVTGENTTLTGKVSMVGEILVIRGKGGEKTREEIVSIIPQKGKWFARWDGKLGLSLGINSGNTNQLDTQFNWNAVYRGAFNRYTLSYIGNYSRVEGITITQNHRATAQWNYYVGSRLFITPIDYSFYNNQFQNIFQQHSIVVGLGYEVIIRPKVEWDLFSGCGYQMNQYDSVQVGEDDIAHDIIMILGTSLSTDITDDIEYNLDYTLQLDVLGEGNLLQNASTYLSVDITNNMEFDIALGWNYINKPQKREDGSVPKKNDITFTFGVSFTY